MALTYGFDLGAVGTQYTAAQFSDVFAALMGDAAAESGGQLRMTLGSGLTVNVAPGYAYAAGRWVKSDAAQTFRLAPAYNTEDRYDAIALTVDLAERRATLELMTDVDPLAPGFLYLIRVRRGASTLYESDVTDNRTILQPLSELSAGGLSAFRFLTSGIDAEVERITARSAAAIAAAEESIDGLRAAIAAKRGDEIGDIQAAAAAPGAPWLLCDGSPVPEAYTALIALIGATLPDLEPEDDRLAYYIYGGET